MLLIDQSDSTPSINSANQNLFFKNPVNFKKDQDKPFTLNVFTETSFNLRFWVKTEPTLPRQITHFLRIAKKDETNGFLLYLNYQNAFPKATSNDEIFIEIAHGPASTINLTQWTLINIGFTVWEDGGACFFKAEVYANQESTPRVSQHGEYPNSVLPSEFVVNIGSFNAFDLFCSR
jgi:hypothetical protein